MNKFLSEKIKTIPPSGIRKFFELVMGVHGVISLGVGEPDFVTPWHIRETSIYSIEKGNTMYTSNFGLLELREEIAKYLKKEYELEYNPKKEILITVGVSEGMDLALRSILNPGDEVIVPEPCYVSYKPCVILANGIPKVMDTKEEDNFQIDVSNLEKLISKKTKAIILSYPNNPTGAIMPKEKLEQISLLAKKYNLIIISDEIYHKLTYENKHTCFPSFKDMKKRTIFLNGFSKTYAMTGWRIGFACANKEIIEAMTKIHQYTMLCAPIMSQFAAIEALKNGEKNFQEMFEEYDRRRRLIVKRLNEIGLPSVEPKGAFYVFSSLRNTNLSSEEFSEKLLFEEKVAVVPGNAFGDCGEGYVRICYASSLSNIEEALKRLEKFVKKYRRR